jgi:hypothetical protein
MTDVKNAVECYVVPNQPYPVLLPVECVASLVSDLSVEPLTTQNASWMLGYVEWQAQRVPVMSYQALSSPDLNELDPPPTGSLVILNLIPGSVRKEYSGLLCHADVTRISVDETVSYKQEMPDGLDKRYVAAVVEVQGQIFIIPKLTALDVAFSYI